MIRFACENNEALDQEIATRLGEFNKSQTDWFSNHPHKSKNKSCYAFDGDKLVGGAVGFVRYNWFYLDLLFVEEAYRKQRIGSQLLRQIEDYAKKENLTGVRLETWDFQALDFYQANGYDVFGEIKDCPPGTIEYHLMKKLQA